MLDFELVSFCLWFKNKNLLTVHWASGLVVIEICFIVFLVWFPLGGQVNVHIRTQSRRLVRPKAWIPSCYSKKKTCSNIYSHQCSGDPDWVNTKWERERNWAWSFPQVLEKHDVFLAREERLTWLKGMTITQSLTIQIRNKKH